MYNLICSTSSCLFIINWFVLITLHFVLLCSDVCVNIPVMKHSTAASLSLSLSFFRHLQLGFWRLPYDRDKAHHTHFTIVSLGVLFT